MNEIIIAEMKNEDLIVMKIILMGLKKLKKHFYFLFLGEYEYDQGMFS